MQAAAAPHPRQFRLSILAGSLVAVATWLGLGLPYSLYAWILDPFQARWVLFCYAWEVPAAGFLGPVLFPMLWLRDITRRWDALLPPRPDGGDAQEIAALEGSLLDFPHRSAVVFLVASVLGYVVGGLQLWLFAQLPAGEVVKVCLLGVATGLVGGLFAFLYLERLLAPLVQHLARLSSDGVLRGRRVPLYVKVFACSLVPTIAGLLLLGPILYSRGERILEADLARRVSTQTSRLADAVEAAPPGARSDPTWWRSQVARLQLGPSAHAYLLDADGRVVAGSGPARSLADEGFRAELQAAVLAGRSGGHVDRSYVPRIVAVAPVAHEQGRVLAVVQRADFTGDLQAMLVRGSVVFLVALALALLQSFLFARTLIRPIEVVTRAAGEIAASPRGPWRSVSVRTNDEVGQLATTFDAMTARLHEARTALERYGAERTELLERERAARADAETANRSKDEFLAMVSHELRAPLQTLLTWTTLLRRGPLEPARAAQALETIERSARRQAQHINDLLDVSRIVTGKLRIDESLVDLAEVAAAAVDEVRMAAEQKRLRLVARTERCFVWGDGRRLHQVVVNLLSNAIKFTPENGVVTLGCESSGREAVITVRDTGTGISADLLPHVFERFRQADTTTTRVHEGLGLGLAIAHHLTELHRGRITAASDGPDRGAVFTVRLPLADAVDETVTARAATADDDGSVPPLAGLAILVVEDDDDSREALAHLLESVGASVTAVSSTHDAVIAVERTRPDVLVSDLSMPGEDGYALVRQLRRQLASSEPRLVAIAVTGLAAPEHRARALAAGFDAHLAKPVDPETLIAFLASRSRGTAA
jgi:signal transduction histidine kinase/ActR/RegA family two-component response regulator